jgi:hypothetical protein
MICYRWEKNNPRRNHGCTGRLVNRSTRSINDLSIDDEPNLLMILS